MGNPAFIITIDTEGDNLWAAPAEITTRNAQFLPRFQALCEEFDFPPSYLVNYEMAIDPGFQVLGKDVIARGRGEIGMHLHAWNSPPLLPISDDDHRYTPYLIEYQKDVIRKKVDYLTKLLEDVFAIDIVSHRAGRWAFNEFYASVLREHGYLVDCSVTPGVDWSANKGLPQGGGGTDYRNFPSTAYFMSEDDISVPGEGCLLQVPMTIRPKYSPYREVVRKHWRKLCGKSTARSMLWVRPRGGNVSEMLAVANEALAAGSGYVEFMLHSSELMPGGSPTFRDEAAIENLYRDLRHFFEQISKKCTGRTLAQFHQTLVATRAVNA